MKKFFVIFSALLCTLLCMFFYSFHVQSGLAANVLRLHILANSDSDADQLLKLRVRDKILSDYGSVFSSCQSKEESRLVFRREKAKMEHTAAEVLSASGFKDMPVSVGLEKTYFPTKYYNNMAFPAGNYDAIRIEIGNAEGQNWWCVMFPPLCFVDGSVKKEVHSVTEAVGDDAAVLLPDSEADVRIRFKIIDTFQKTGHTIAEALKNL